MAFNAVSSPSSASAVQCYNDSLKIHIQDPAEKPDDF